MVHSVGSQRVGLGENLAWWSDSRGQTPSIFARHIQALQMYVDECEPFVSDMKAGTGSLQGNTAAYGHLSQVLWRPSTTIGCGVCVTGNGREALSVCHYGPAGNMGGSNILGERL
ncbi:CAP domain-containing protein [Chytridium lagenaria]|nr:CAP domain-containing protein [Chytridium lagenaria]